MLWLTTRPSEHVNMPHMEVVFRWVEVGCVPFWLKQPTSKRKEV